MVGTLASKRAMVLLFAAATATLVVVLAVATSKPAGAATDVLPDLRMARLQNLQIKTCADTSGDCDFAGQRQLRFDAIIVNVGPGAMELRGRRPNTSTSMTVYQRIFNDAGGYRERTTTAQMYFAGDGHNHWHLKNLESYDLIRLDNGRKVGTQAKEGFCFSDNYPFGSSQAAYYTGSTGNCGSKPDAQGVFMGLSRGWGDIYRTTTVDQFIGITNLKSGRYRLRATADKPNWFSETNNSNNFTWVDIRIRGSKVHVIRYGPAAQPI